MFLAREAHYREYDDSGFYDDMKTTVVLFQLDDMKN